MRLSPEEREARRKARARFSFSDAAYAHYDPETEGFGGPEEWVRNAERLFNVAAKRPQTALDKLLAVLGLSAMPVSLAALTVAFRATMFKVHPDYGGTNEQAREALEAFAALKRKL